MPSDIGRTTRPARTGAAGFGGTAPSGGGGIQMAQMPSFGGGGGNNSDQANMVQTGPAPAPVAAPAPAQAAPVAPPPPAMTNSATPNPQIQQADADYRARLAQLQQGRGTDPNQQFMVDRFKQQLGADNSQGLIDREQFRIADQAAARKAAMTNQSGRMGAGAGASDFNRIDSAAARAQAASADNINLAQQARTDNLLVAGQQIMNSPANMELAREGNLNQMTLAGLPYAQAQANNTLGQQQLGLAQWNSQANYGLGAASLAQQGNIAASNQAMAQQQAAQQAAQAQQQMQLAYWSQLTRSMGY